MSGGIAYVLDEDGTFDQRCNRAMVALQDMPEWIEGEMHGDAALSDSVRRSAFPGSRLKGDANVLIMPTLDAANIAFNLLKTAAGDGITVGPILLGAAKPVHIVTPTATVRRLVNMTALTVVDVSADRGNLALPF